MNMDIAKGLDTVKKRLDQIGDAAGEAFDKTKKSTSEFHDKYTSKVIPKDGIYKDVANFAADMTPVVGTVKKFHEGDTILSRFKVNNLKIETNQIDNPKLLTWLGFNTTGANNLKSFEVKQSINSMIKSRDGSKLDLETLNKRVVDSKGSEYTKQMAKQQAGWAGEIISTTKENLENQHKNSPIRTYRADDRPDLYSSNDPYVDKIRVDIATGETLERIQTKFVGKNSTECFNRLNTKKFEKYFNDGKVDKLEIPKDFYDEVKQLFTTKINKLEKQLEYATQKNDLEKVQKITERLNYTKKQDGMLLRSNTTSAEALFAVKHPKLYEARLKGIELPKAVIKDLDKKGLGVTVALSTVDNVKKVLSGEQSAEGAAIDIAKESGSYVVFDQGTKFISQSVSKAMTNSGKVLVKKVAGGSIPTAVAVTAIDSLDSTIAFAKGEIKLDEYAYELGESAVGVAGSMVVGAKVGTLVGSVAGPVGSAAGLLIGSTAGYVVATEAYQTAIEVGSEEINEIADKAQELANDVIDSAEEFIPEKVDELKTTINDFSSEFNLPFHV